MKISLSGRSHSRKTFLGSMVKILSKTVKNGICWCFSAFDGTLVEFALNSLASGNFGAGATVRAIGIQNCRINHCRATPRHRNFGASLLVLPIKQGVFGNLPAFVLPLKIPLDTFKKPAIICFHHNLAGIR